MSNNTIYGSTFPLAFSKSIPENHLHIKGPKEVNFFPNSYFRNVKKKKMI